MAGQSGASGSSSGAHSGGAPSPASSGGTADVSDLLADYEERFEEQGGLLQQTQQQLRDVQGQHGETTEVLQRLKEALNGPQQGRQATPDDAELEQLNAKIDHYLQVAIAAERAGKPMPVTIQGHVDALTTAVAHRRELMAIKAENASTKQQLARLTNPAFQVDQQAFASMDGMLMGAMQTFFGDDPEMSSVRDAQFKSVAGLISSEINRLKAEEPDIWERVRRNPADQRKLVNHFAQKAIPPAARNLMQQQQIQNTPITYNDLKQAWQESQQIEDPVRRAKIQDHLRPQLLSGMFQSARNRDGGNGNVRVNDLF